MKELHTVAEVAERYGLTPTKVLRRMKDPHAPWPHLRPNRRDSSTWRFSDDHIEDIDKRIARGMQPIDSWGRERRRSA